MWLLLLLLAGCEAHIGATEGPNGLFGISLRRHAPAPPATVTTTTVEGCGELG